MSRGPYDAETERALRDGAGLSESSSLGGGGGGWVERYFALMREMPSDDPGAMAAVFDALMALPGCEVRSRRFDRHVRVTVKRRLDAMFARGSVSRSSTRTKATRRAAAGNAKATGAPEAEWASGGGRHGLRVKR